MDKIKHKALTFDDVLLLPRYTDFLPVDANLDTRISRNITLKILTKNKKFLESYLGKIYRN